MNFAPFGGTERSAGVGLLVHWHIDFPEIASLVLVSPALVFGFVISSFYGVAFYLLFGHGWVRLWAYWLIGILGFAVGQWVGGVIGLSALNVGAVNFLEATLMSWIGLFGARALRR